VPPFTVSILRPSAVKARSTRSTKRSSRSTVKPCTKESPTKSTRRVPAGFAFVSDSSSRSPSELIT
jgi:hypothetical protein